MADTSTPHHGRPSHRARSSRRVVSGAVIGLIALSLVAVGVLAAALLLPDRLPASLEPAPGPTTVAVTDETYDGSHQVAATPQTAPALRLKSAASGVVTASACAVGQTVISGGSPFSVDGRPLLALATAEPLWRDLTADLAGADVTALQTELARLGQAVEPTGTYDTATRQAVKSALAAVGVSSPEDSLPLSSVVWLPAPEVTVSACPVLTGDSVTPGEVVAEVGGGLRSLLLTSPPGDGWVAAYGDHTAPVDADGLVTDPDLLSAVEAGPEYHLFSTTGQAVLSLTVRLAEPVDVLVVPPSAILVSGPDTGCLVAEGRTVPVRIVASSLGQTRVAVVSGAPPAAVALDPDESVVCR